MLNPKAQPRAMAVGRHPIVAALQLVGMVEEVSPEGCIRGRCCRRCCHFQCHSIGPSQSLLLWLVILRAIAWPEAIQRLTQVPVAAAATKHASWPVNANGAGQRSHVAFRPCGVRKECIRPEFGDLLRRGRQAVDLERARMGRFGIHRGQILNVTTTVRNLYVTRYSTWYCSTFIISDHVV